ncbi:MAG: PQQ-binding-like beta-propeller repeat protein [Planctomycetaceae bacterium]|nr:PQQ-binding-like beta-propeller repeat protein [Planctomycetaceae bacterium]
MPGQNPAVTAADANVSPRRWRFPLLVTAVVGLLIIVAWTAEHDRLDNALRTVITILVGLLASIVLFLWWVLFSGFSIRLRVLVAVLLIAVVGSFVSSVRQVAFTGDMTPQFTFRWEPLPADELEAHRAGMVTHDAVPTVEVSKIGPSDIAEYRGPQRDGIVAGPALSRDWETSPPPLRWRQPVGLGYASFAVVGPTAITIEQRRENEAVVCYDTSTGAELWVHKYPALFEESLGGNGPRATPTIFADVVVALGGTGVLSCLDRATGDEKWSVTILEDNGVKNVEWGMAGSPLVVNDMVIVAPGAQKGGEESSAVVGYDIQTGNRMWSGGKTTASYASPVLATLDGVDQVVQFDAGGLSAYDVTTGQRWWHHPWKSEYDTNAAQPVLLPGDRVLITSNVGVTLLQLTHEESEWTITPLWKNRNLKADYANAIARDGYLYGLDKGIMVCLDLESGERLWKGGRYGHGQMLLSNDLLVLLSEKGELVLVEATPQEHRELTRFQAIEGRTWNNPTLVDGIIYIRNHLEMASYDLRASTSP